MAYQPPNGDVVVANSSNWRLPNTVVDSSYVAIKSSIALLGSRGWSALEVDAYVAVEFGRDEEVVL